MCKPTQSKFMVDGRWLKYADTKKRKEAVELAIKCETQAKAADKMGITQRVFERHLQKVKANAIAQGDALLPLRGQSRRMFTDDGVFSHWDKTYSGKVNPADLIKDIQAGINCKLAKPKNLPKFIESEICSVLCIADVHLGMMAYSPETGNDSWGTDTARDLMICAIDHLMPRNHKVDHVFVLNVGDLGHYSGMQAKTEQSGHVLDADARPGYIIRTAVMVMRYAIDKALLCANTVEVGNLQGNHDSLLAMAINIALQMHYADEPRVTIKDNDCKVITTTWGKNFIYAHHGDGVSNQKMYNAMTRDFPVEFGQANHHWLVSGHLHSSRKEPIGNAKIETLSTLAPPDAWHASKLYGAHREMIRVDLHERGCELGRKSFNPVFQAEASEVA